MFSQKQMSLNLHEFVSNAICNKAIVQVRGFIDLSFQKVDIWFGG